MADLAPSQNDPHVTEEQVTASGGQSLWVQNTGLLQFKLCSTPTRLWGLLVGPIIEKKGHSSKLASAAPTTH